MKILVDCSDCQHFINPIYKEEDNFFSKIKINAKCKLGKRVVFKMYNKNNEHYAYGMYARYCKEFKQL